MTTEVGTVADDDRDLAELLLPDPDLMGSPEGDTKGLQELKKAARKRIDELQHS